MVKEQNSFIKKIAKGVLFAVIVSLVGLLIFSAIVKMAYLQTGVIRAVNQFIKILSVFLACTFCLENKSGLIGGGLIGLFSSLITYLLFSLFFGQLSFGASFFIDTCFMLIIGCIAGIICVNLKRQ